MHDQTNQQPNVKTECRLVQTKNLPKQLQIKTAMQQTEDYVNRNGCSDTDILVRNLAQIFSSE